jgi:hypothetical protein
MKEQVYIQGELYEEKIDIKPDHMMLLKLEDVRKYLLSRGKIITDDELLKSGFSKPHISWLKRNEYV